MATQGTPYITATRTAIKPKTPLENAAAPTLTAAAPPTDYSGQINKQFDLAQSKLTDQRSEAGRSALENAQRAGAIRGTSGAGFETGIQQQAVNDATKPYNELSTGLDTERSSQLTAAGQAGDALKEQQRQFDFGANLQRYTAANEMDMNKFSTFINSATALKQAGFNDPKAWSDIFKGSNNPYADALNQGGIVSPSVSPIQANAPGNYFYTPAQGNY